jgi:DNA anti-recombination protein RmuC
MKTYSLALLTAATVLWTGCDPVLEEVRINTMPAPSNTIEGSASTDPNTSAIPPATDAATLAQQKANVLATAERAVDEIDLRLDSLASSAQQVELTSRTELESALATLRTQRRQMDSLLDRMRQATGTEWQDLQNDFRSVYQTLLHSLEGTEELLRR